MKRSLFVSLVFQLLALSVAEGQVRAFLNTGVGSYSMKQLKSFQFELEHEFDIVPNRLSSFPNYYNYEGGATYDLGAKQFVGITAGYGSTGARSDYHDYSGSITIDQAVKYHSFGATYGWKYNLWKDRLLLHLEMRPMVIVSSLRTDIVATLYDERDAVQLETRSLNYSLQPMATLSPKLGPLSIDFYLGYQLSMRNGILKSVEDKNLYLVFAQGVPVKASWDGLRAGIGLSAHIDFKKKNSVSR